MRRGDGNPGFARHAISTVLCSALLAQVDPCAATSPFPEGSHERLISTVGSAETDAYRAVLRDFDAYLQANPGDSIAAVERCRFITDFAYREDGTIESAYDESEACIDALAGGEQASRPEVKLFLLEQKWGDEAIQEAEGFLEESRGWPAARRAALHAKLSMLLSDSDPDKAGRHATLAVGLDPGTAVQLTAATYQLRIGAPGKAVELILSMPDESWNPWILEQAVDVLLQAGEAAAAYGLVESQPGIALDEGARYGLARALMDAGDTAAARALLRRPRPESDDASADEARGRGPLRKLFEFQRDYGSPAEAQAAYRELRDAGWRADPFAWYRLSLATVSPAAPWQARDLLGLGALALALAIVAILPLIVVAPIHYRSLARRQGGIPVPELSAASPWTLRDMWYATGAVLTITTIALYAVAYPYFESLIAPLLDGYESAGTEVDHAALGRAYVLGNVFCVVAMIPLLRKVPLNALVATRWSPARSILVGAGTGLGFVFLAAMVKGLLAWSGLAIGPGSEAFMAMQGIDEAYGPLVLIAFACVLTPLLEEFVFRGVVLRAGARHLALWASVLVQAALFTAWHEDPGDYPVLFLFALACAWLAFRSGGLAAPVAFHAVVNLVAVAAILRFSNAVNPAG